MDLGIRSSFQNHIPQPKAGNSTVLPGPKTAKYKLNPLSSPLLVQQLVILAMAAKVRSAAPASLRLLVYLGLKGFNSCTSDNPGEAVGFAKVG